MKVLIVYAHPETPGHCPTILDSVKSELDTKEADYEVIDLYQEKYDPVLHEDEHYTSGNREISKQNRMFQNKITDSDLLVFIHPIWWGSMPAILKGWYDRVLTPHFAYKYEDGRPVKLLKGKKAIVFMTAGGSWLTYKLALGLPQKLISFGILGFCGIRSKVHTFYSCRKLDERKVDEIRMRVRKVISGI